MKRLVSVALLFTSLAASAGVPATTIHPPEKPNIIFILADDLGYGDVGIFYQNSRPSGKPRMVTPQLDRMAAEGVILRQHYSSSPVCAPARASLLLGQHQGNCAIHNNQFDKALPHNHTLATVLKQAGYHTAAIGKWGLAGQTELPPVFAPDTVPAHPLRRGFDEFFGFIDHAAGHVYYHDAEHPLYEDYTNVTAHYPNIYSTDLFFARAKKFIRDHESAHPDQPFFLYLALTAVHAALQVPGGPFPPGGGLQGGLQWPLTPTPDTADQWIHPDYAHAITPWRNEVIKQAEWPPAMKRYATMTRRLDDSVGDLLHLLRDLNLATNTLVVFSSDNGPANEADRGPYASDPRYFDSWADMDGIKRDLWEAGVREPTIAWWPGTIPAGRISDQISAFWDWLPTFAAASGQAPPAQADGVSLLPALTGQGTQRSRGFVYFEYFIKARFPVDGNKTNANGLFARKQVTGRGELQSIRLGNYVAVRYSITNSTDPFRLYNVITDPHEDRNIADDPALAPVLAQARDMVKEVRHPDPEAPRPYDPDLVPAVSTPTGTAGTLTRSLYLDHWPWVPDFDALPADRTAATPGLDVSGGAINGAYGLRFRGFIQAPVDGPYTFWLTDDSGAQLWLHEIHLVDDDYNHTGNAVSGTVRLKGGWHPLRLFYRHAEGKPRLQLEYAGPGIPRQTVPVTAFAPAD